MEPKFTWKGEIQFAGTPEEFNALSAALEKLNVNIIPVVPWPRPPFPGLLPIPVGELLGTRLIDELAGAAALKAHIKFLKGFRGGIREPHLHLESEVAFLDQASFKAYVGQVAQALAERRVDLAGDYINVMAGLEPLAAIPIQIP